jgi:putative membrane protein
VGYVEDEVINMMYWNGMGMGWWGWLMMLVFWGSVIFLIVWAVRPGRTVQEDGALRILDERLAKGEIDAEEYRERRSLLEVRR